MPAVSEAQRRLMFEAASRKGGYRGVPQHVGKEFVDADTGGKLPAHVRKPATKSAREHEMAGKIIKRLNARDKK